MPRYPVALLSQIPASTSPVEIIAHRGGGDNTQWPSRAPENTIPGFTSAIGRAHAIEFDVQITSDGYPMVMHDNTVDRTTDGTGDVLTLSRAQLEALDAGAKYDARWAGTRVPRLESALEVCKRFQWCYPEIKRVRSGSREQDIKTIVQAIQAAGLEPRTVLQSANGDVDFPFVRALSRTIVLGYLADTLSKWTSSLALAEADGNAVMIADRTFLLANATVVADAKGRGVDVIAYTPNTADLCVQLLAIGVTRLITDNLDAVAALNTPLP